MAMIDERDDDLIGAVMQDTEHEIMIDTGACTSVCNHGHFDEKYRNDEPTCALRSITGMPMKSNGKVRVPMQLPTGRVASIAFQKTDSKRVVLSVGEAVSLGYSFVFTPEGSYMMKGSPKLKGEQLEPIDQRDTLFFMKTRARHDSGTVAGFVLPGGDGMADVELDFDQDVKEQLVQDLALQEQEIAQQSVWVQGQEQQPQEPQALAAPRSPTQDEIDAHSITHYPSVDWCPCYVERSGGILHYRRDRDAQVGEVQIDYTFWSLSGIMDNIDEKATPSLTAVDRTTSLVLACVVERKGVWAYALAMGTGFLRMLGYDSYVLLGDGESSLQAYLRALCDTVTWGKCVVRKTAPGNHQRIGAVENRHKQLGSEIRVLAKQLSETGNIDMIPGSFLHVWAIRHNQFLLNHVHLRDGASPFLIATGKQLKVSLAKFGESVHWKVAEPLKQGKSAPR
jgi:hypothetical protein